MSNINKIVFATGNAGKMKEIRMILADIGMEILSMKEAGVAVEVDENGTTFEEIDSIEYEEDYIDDDALFEEEYAAAREFAWECVPGR